MAGKVRGLLLDKLYTLGVIISCRSGTPYLQGLLENRAEYVRQCEDSFVGSLWSIITGSDGFWENIKDFRFICVLCSTCKTFSYTLQTDKTAWMAVANNLPHMENKAMASVFLVPLKQFAKKKSYLANVRGAVVQFVLPRVRPVDALRMSYRVNNGPVGFYAKRRWKQYRLQARNKRPKIHWPPQVLHERIWPFFVNFLLLFCDAKKDLGVSLETQTALIWHSALSAYIKREAKLCNLLFLERQIYDFMLITYLHCKDHTHYSPLIQYCWRRGHLMWLVSIKDLVLHRYPYAGEGILRRGYPPSVVH
mgnify:CR=1 FL=1